MNRVPSDPIPEFYDRHPYPPAVDDIDADLEAWSDGARRRVEHFRMWPTEPYRNNRTILVAGCGTSQAARYAARYPHSRVIGVDVSRSSIKASKRLAATYDLTNLEVHELPVERVAALEETFDLIVCTGVLHHLSDPQSGLRALRDVLAEKGALRLMVYAQYGRFGVSMLQDYCRRLGIRADDDEIDDLTATLRELPLGHPLGHVLRDTPDFHDDAAIADALLNPRERAYTVPQLLDEIDSAGMRFARWIRQAPYQPSCGAISEVPHAARLAALPEAEQFAAMELFRGTIRRHSLIAYRDDADLPSVTSGVRPGWERIVPLLDPATVIVEERLPPGVAGVLINRAHVDRDIVLFLDANQRSVVEAIDGTTRFGEIPGASPELFDTLWRHDAVVTDEIGVTR